MSHTLAAVGADMWSFLKGLASVVWQFLGLAEACAIDCAAADWECLCVRVC